MTAPRVMGLAGWSGAGKTTLIERVLPHLRAAGLSVSTIKHAHAGFDIDRPGKDSFRHRKAGAAEVLVVSPERFALLGAVVGEPDLRTLVNRLGPVDLVLVEGFRHGCHAKLEVHRASLGKPLIYPADPAILAIARDDESRHPLPAFPLDDAGAVAAFIASTASPLA